ncbi:beta-N-acetylhexosaminidase [Tenuibacillus multivorans]|uniref:Beta-N-acetylhexosaminidase n=1 Tax=Tenuibacillus multivorans TaxID=237069 RepID=A0A1H0DVY9_9BACI|nr:beta-N-acetylhexosaminidase [Tenuibacillus multivorans]GEL76762.1 glycoside hydrolase family 3 [Tenuibacillus multivorans]SDN74196.1 beta-N-acetylhexosaminidase [Tenuibacillus multivorans]
MVKNILVIIGIVIFGVYFYQAIDIEEFIQSQNNDKEQQSQRDPIQEKIHQMTLEEKIGQMIMTGVPGTTTDEQTLHLINEFHVGGLIFFDQNLKDPSQITQFLNQIKSENQDNPLPLFLGVDQEGGRVQRLPVLQDIPSSQKVGEIDDEEFSYEIGRLLGKQLHAFGFNIDFAPVLDINNNPNNVVIGDRSFGSTAERVSQHGIQVMKGLQSEGITPVIKHFPGHGDTGTDSHSELPVIRKNLEELKSLELIPFKKAIEEGADMVMAAHILLPKIDEHNPSSLSKPIITDVLRKQLGFDGVVVTDDMTMKAITKYNDIEQAAVQSIQAGTDLIMIAHEYDRAAKTIQAIKTAVEQGEITEERINKSVHRIIELKQKYDLNNEPVERANIEQLNQEIEKLLSTYSSLKGNN